MKSLVVRTSLLAVAALAALAPAAGAQGGPTLSVSPSSGLAAGQLVTVSGSGYAPGQGLYVQFCADPGGERARRCNPDQANEHTIWKTPVAPDGTWSVELRVESSFGDVNCLEETCGAFTRRDHMGGAEDFSQDAFAAVTFAAQESGPAEETTATTTATAAPTGELAFTGSTSTLALAGVLAIGLGSVLLVARRRATSA